MSDCESEEKTSVEGPPFLLPHIIGLLHELKLETGTDPYNELI